MTSSSCKVSVLLSLNLMFLAANLLTGDQRGRDNVIVWQVTLVADRSCSNCCDGTRSVPCCLIKFGGSIHRSSAHHMMAAFGGDEGEAMFVVWSC